MRALPILPLYPGAQALLRSTVGATAPVGARYLATEFRYRCSCRLILVLCPAISVTVYKATPNQSLLCVGPQLTYSNVIVSHLWSLHGLLITLLYVT